jgi:hypothetical protein
MDANTEKGAHRLLCRTFSNDPRRYRGVCMDCDWTTEPLRGNEVYAEMGKHSGQTVPQAIYNSDPTT